MSKDIWVVVETLRGEVLENTYTMLAAGRVLADASQGKLIAVLLGSKAEKLAGTLAVADGVTYVDDAALAEFTPDAYERTIAGLVKQAAPRAVLMGHSSMGMDVASGVSIELGLPLVSACQTLSAPEAGDVDIAKESILVSVGRGIGQKDNIALAQELADALGGAVCASRPIVDQGWLPTTRLVGKSGKSVKPRLYLALGISGAPEHHEGMSEAECIVAVNTDEKAPILDFAQYGATVDALKLLPALTARVKQAKGG
jgi:electron transfer flavoprotein alpha subunit